MSHQKIRFIGYAIPTTPANLVAIGDGQGPGGVAGTYLGDEDFQQDFRHRLQILKHAVDTAKSRLPAGESDVINLFVAPEFFFHGPLGPYVFGDPGSDPVTQMTVQLAATFNETEYPNWTFVCGTVVTSQIRDLQAAFRLSSTSIRNQIVRNLSEQWSAAFGPLKEVVFEMLVNFVKVCHSHPVCTVRDRAVIVSNIPVCPPRSELCTNLLTTEKYHASNDDFLLFETTGKQVITEQMMAYPPIDLSAGDFKHRDFDPYAVFKQSQLNAGGDPDAAVAHYGVEICLDHLDARLRRHLDCGNGGIDVQVIPSCGMQIQASSIAANDNGWVFNCDGQYALNEQPLGRAVMQGVDCLFANYHFTAEPSTRYGAHSQLARVETAAREANPNSPDSRDATLLPLDANDITVVEITPADQLGNYFAGGAGQVHIYGLTTPYDFMS